MRTFQSGARLRKVVDETNSVRSKSGSVGLIREEVWQDTRNRIVKYNLAHIHHGVCHAYNGRVLGYDNAHGFHERHFMGTSEEAAFTTYGERLHEFLSEVEAWRDRT